MFDPCKPFQASVMFVVKSGATEGCLTRVGSGITCIHLTSRPFQARVMFYIHNILMFPMFDPCKPFQASVMFVVKSGATERCLIRVGSGLTCIHLISLERLVREHSSLLRTFVNYRCKFVLYHRALD